MNFVPPVYISCKRFFLNWCTQCTFQKYFYIFSLLHKNIICIDNYARFKSKLKKNVMRLITWIFLKSLNLMCPVHILSIESCFLRKYTSFKEFIIKRNLHIFEFRLTQCTFLTCSHKLWLNLTEFPNQTLFIGIPCRKGSHFIFFLLHNVQNFYIAA